jgi:prolipoprotein diacylglyceryltransferase
MFDGQMVLAYFSLAGLVRFVVEFFRSPLDYRGPVLWGWMPLTQALALTLAVGCGLLLLYFTRKARLQPQA